MSGAQSISARRAYGVQRVCRVWGRARSSVYVRRHATRSRASRRRGPVGAATDEVAGRPHPPGARSLTVSWRRVPESVGEAAGREDPHLAGTGATVDAGARPPGPVPRVSAARRGVGGRARAVGSRACVVGNSTEVECGEHGGVLEREVGDPHSSGVSGAAAQLHGLPLLGARVLRQHRRFGGRGHPRLHPEAGSRREETGETGTWLIEGPFEGPSSYRPLRGR